MNNLIVKYRSPQEFEDAISSQIKELEKKIDDYSKFMGDKIRSNQEISKDDPDIKEFEKKIKKGPDKKKKKPSKKNKDTQWFDIEELQIYNGSVIKGEIELYFNAVEQLKTKLEKLNKAKSSLDSLVKKGLKANLGCIVLCESEVPSKLVLTQTPVESKKFSFKSIINIRSEPTEILLKAGK